MVELVKTEQPPAGARKRIWACRKPGPPPHESFSTSNGKRKGGDIVAGIGWPVSGTCECRYAPTWGCWPAIGMKRTSSANESREDNESSQASSAPQLGSDYRFPVRKYGAGVSVPEPGSFPAGAVAGTRKIHRPWSLSNLQTEPYLRS